MSIWQEMAKNDQKNISVPVIDLFAGPGGLGEGFHSYNDDGIVKFDTSLSIEKEASALKTLTLRTFFRAFHGDVPDEYYQYVRGEIASQEELFKMFPEQAHEALKIVNGIELASNKEAMKRTDTLVEKAVKGKPWWLLIGGPPCQAYSLVGRSRMVGKIGREEFEKDPRHFLYREYLRIIEKFRPPFFVMENVKGLISAKHGGENMFDKIIRDLSNPSVALNKDNSQEVPAKYHIHSFVKECDDGSELQPNDYVIECEKFGIPQSRHRVILFGIRADLDVLPTGVLQEENTVSTGEVIRDLPELRSGISTLRKKQFEIDVLNIVEHSTLCDADKWQALVEFYFRKSKNWANLEKEMAKALQLLRTELSTGGNFVESERQPQILGKWYGDKRIKGALNHEARSHMPSDLIRYLFVSVFGQTKEYSPKLVDWPEKILPEHKNVTKAAKGRSSNFTDRFKVQLEDKPASTIVSHISKDGHYYIHYDPAQCRSFTVREAARIQTFPDNYFFEGSRTHQFTQVGNAVPPLLAFKLAGIVANTILDAMANSKAEKIA